MIREQQILRGVLAHYEGAPTIKVSVDGGNDSVSITAPNHASYRTRFLTESRVTLGIYLKQNLTQKTELIYQLFQNKFLTIQY